jgi:multiple sugar transport system substrate-binding protein
MPSRTRRQVLAALAAAGLAGCNSLGGSEPSTEAPDSTPASSPTPESPEVVVMTNDKNERWQQKWEQEIAPGFEAQSDATVRIEYSTSPPQVPPTQRLVDEGNPPEVYYNDAVAVARHALEGDLQPVDNLVDDLVAANGDLHVEYPIRSEGEPHIVPHGLHLGGVLHYRRDVYDELGLSVPETWAELVENARVIDESDQFDTRGFAVSGVDASADKTRDDFISWLYTAGGRFWRWQDEPGGRVELDFQTEQVHATLGLLNRLAQYSPDPAEIGGASIVGEWFTDNVAQCLFPNAWLAGLTYDIESDPEQDRSVSVSPNTAVAPAPLRDRTLDPPTRGWVHVDGTPMFRGANTEYAEEFLRYMYEGPQRQADKNNVTMRRLPPYEGIFETEAYRSADIYQAEDGYFLDLERQLLEEVLPLYTGERPRTPAARYAMQPIPPDTTGEYLDAEPDILTELVQAVLVEAEPMDDAIARARQRLQSRLEDGRDLSG